ncbi:hypothetical protein HWC53_gp060 [Bacillus phage vB_BmeM-Goe8]|uniref:Uncharacterized protein n=1 Tax=Bacillus phage vB_BmeM-Goe8 TaxID=2593638 RepID=A0A516KMI0_9CAUD|nr:hypothetical protein HWC53_gp018 [Bacillus phage vB_BmeM-Goe8]YP_009850190.1 hypothetical protein HWC53_gp060 [Bacillus phage vB_BmeM-Goe8]QDP42802.1 hypothetical protein Goe8_c00180 [Bacillus phage vB_BmeM-Goe8]QDP43029.1 hypothetical protein Goe8_c02560 [Bacillus phage vB_BmeM-Goe8]
MILYRTTTELLEAAKKLKEAAKLVQDATQHRIWWDKKVDVLRAVNGALESGAFTGDAYAELKEARYIIGYAEAKAGGYFSWE